MGANAGECRTTERERERLYTHAHAHTPPSLSSAVHCQDVTPPEILIRNPLTDEVLAPGEAYVLEASVSTIFPPPIIEYTDNSNSPVHVVSAPSLQDFQTITLGADTSRVLPQPSRNRDRERERERERERSVCVSE